MSAPHRRRQSGAALLVAMLTVALVAIFAAAALWQQWRSTEVEAAERARIQSGWILNGGLDWARLILREDKDPIDHLGEPWAITLQEARLSSFLAADGNNSVDSGQEVMDAFLSGQIVDMHSLLNVYNLVDASGKEFEGAVNSFVQLFDLLGLPQEQLDQLVANMVLARKAATQPGAEAPLMPQRIEQLAWLGLPAQTVAALRPYVTLLDPNADQTPVNLNTAGAEVIYAALPGLTMAEARSLVAARENSYFRTRDDALRLVNDGVTRFPAGQGQVVGVQSQFFEVRSRLRLDQLVVEERALVRRSSGLVTVIRRERGAPSSTIDPGSTAPR